MKKSACSIVFSLLILAGILNAQSVSRKWAIIQDLDDRIVYLDTTTIKEFDQNITIWSLVIYREPKEVSPFQQKVSQIKSQFMINGLLKKYSVIGTLYYDAKGKMLGESSIPSYSFGSENLSIPIVEGSSIDVLYNRAKDYLTLGRFANEKSEFLKNFDKNVVDKSINAQIGKSTLRDSLEAAKSQNLAVDSAVTSRLNEANRAVLPVNDPSKQQTVKEPPKQKPVPKDTLKADTEGVNKLINQKIDSTNIKARNVKKVEVDSSAYAGLKKELANEKDIPLIKQKIEPEAVIQKPAENPAQTKKNETNKPAEKKPEPKISTSSGYDYSKETNPSGVIFTDGRLYCFQVSSWKQKSQAESELNRLSAKGHNAFIQEADIPGKGKWYRVRIGYFNSMNEAAEYKRKVK